MLADRPFLHFIEEFGPYPTVRKEKEEHRRVLAVLFDRRSSLVVDPTREVKENSRGIGHVAMLREHAVTVGPMRRVGRTPLPTVRDALGLRPCLTRAVPDER
jgi:hypothetical protein